MSETPSFLEFISGDTCSNIIRATGPKYGGKQFTIEYSEIDGRKDELEIFIIPCLGGVTVEEINEYPCVYADVDVGKDDKENYFPEDVVRERKQEILARLRDSILPTPSSIIDGRNGYHFYWRFRDRPQFETWLFLQQRIRTLLKGDPAVESPHQPMRYPGTFWRKKNGGNHPEYEFTEIARNDTWYTSEELVHLLRDVEVAPKETRPSNRARSAETNTEMSIDWTNDMVSAICRDDVAHLQSKLKPTPKRLQNSTEVHQYLTHEVSLGAFLGIRGKRCRCPFHQDRDPSAGIFTTRTGEEFFKCFCCGKRGNIKAIVQMLRGCSPVESCAFLKNVFMIEQSDNQWQIEQKERLDTIAHRVTTALSRHDALSRNISRDLPVFDALIHAARTHAFTVDYTSTVDGRPIFFVSMRHIARTTGFSFVRVSRAVVNLALHGLIHRCGDEEIPTFLLQKSILHRKARLEFARRAERISYYIINDCTDEQLRDANDIAKQVQDAHLTRSGLSYEGVCRTFGEEIANRIYVLRCGRPVSKASDERHSLILDILNEQIENHGWTCEAGIVKGMEARWKSTLAARQVKRSLPSIIADHIRPDGETAYIRVQLNKVLKLKLGIRAKGYGEIIMLRDEYERVMHEIIVASPPRRKRGRPRKDANSTSRTANPTFNVDLRAVNL